MQAGNVEQQSRKELPQALPRGRPHSRRPSTFSLPFIWELPLLIFKCYLILPRKMQQVQGGLVSHQKTDTPADPSPRTPPAAPARPPQGTGRTVDWPPHCRHMRAATASGGTSSCTRTLVPVGVLCENVGSGVSTAHPDNCELPQGSTGLQAPQSQLPTPGSAARASAGGKGQCRLCGSDLHFPGVNRGCAPCAQCCAQGPFLGESCARDPRTLLPGLLLACVLDSGCQLNVLQVGVFLHRVHPFTLLIFLVNTSS